MVLFFYVGVEKLTHGDPGVLRFNVMLLIVTRKPSPKGVVLFESCVVYVLYIDCSLVEDVSWLWKALVHVGHIVVLVFFDHVSDLFITYEHRGCFRCGPVLNPEILRNCYHSERLFQPLVSIDVDIRESNFALILISENSGRRVKNFAMPELFSCFPCFDKRNEPRFIWI